LSGEYNSPLVICEENGSWTWEFEDAVGHTGEATAVVTWIDTMEPEALLVLYTPTETTNEEVTATVVVNRPVEVPEGRTAVDEHSSLLASGMSSVFAQTFTENRTGMVVSFVDVFGRTGSTGVDITRIDRTPAVPAITYSPETATKSNVVATVSFDKP
jgi:hypothetical protein